MVEHALKIRPGITRHLGLPGVEARVEESLCLLLRFLGLNHSAQR